MFKERERTAGVRPASVWVAVRAFAGSAALAVVAAVMALVALAGTPAHAGGGIYLGLGFGPTATDAETADLDDGSLTSASLDDEDDALQAFVGYRFNGIVALELGYTDAGELRFDGVSDGSQVLLDGYDAGPVAATIETQLAALQVLVGVPLGPVRLYGRAGGHFWAADGGLTNAGFDYDLDDFDLEESGTGLIYGVGVAVHPLPKLGLRAEWQTAEDAIVGERDLELVTVAAYIRF